MYKKGEQWIEVEPIDDSEETEESNVEQENICTILGDSYEMNEEGTYPILSCLKDIIKGLDEIE